MANIKVELIATGKLKISFVGRQARHLRLSGSWTDWMLAMNDFRDLIIPLNNNDIGHLINKLLNDSNKLKFKQTAMGQELCLSADQKIVRSPDGIRKPVDYNVPVGI